MNQQLHFLLEAVRFAIADTEILAIDHRRRIDATNFALAMGACPIATGPSEPAERFWSYGAVLPAISDGDIATIYTSILQPIFG